MALYYRQVSVDIKIQNYKIKTGIDLKIFILKSFENCLLYVATNSFSEWLRTGSYPADIIRFRSHTGKCIHYD